jgi:hypothetical protein
MFSVLTESASSFLPTASLHQPLYDDVDHSFAFRTPSPCRRNRCRSYRSSQGTQKLSHTRTPLLTPSVADDNLSRRTSLIGAPPVKLSLARTSASKQRRLSTRISPAASGISASLLDSTRGTEATACDQATLSSCHALVGFL